jgi:nucleoid DNA-binding protein
MEAAALEILNDIKSFATDISHTFGIPRSQAEEIVKEVFNSLVDKLTSSGAVGVKHFGSFKIVKQRNMKFFDFKSQKVKEIVRNVITFYPSQNFKRLANSVDAEAVHASRLSKKAAKTTKSTKAEETA